MTQQSQVASLNGAEQESTSTATAELQAASSSETGQASANSMTEDTCHKDEPLPWYFKLLFAVVIGLWLALLGWEISSTAFDWSDLVKLGTFGDSFGALNTLFSGLAFLGIIISIKYQRDDLKLQREELAMQRKEITFQRKAIEIQAQEAKHQSEEMKSQRRLAQEYQDERFFVLLLEQIKGYSILKRKDEIEQQLNACYYELNEKTGYTVINRDRKYIEKIINDFYAGIDEINASDECYLKIDNFLSRIIEKCNYFQLLFDKITQLHEFIISISNITIQENYAKITYNCIGQYDRILVFMYLVALLKLRQGDIMGDLLYNFYKKEMKI